MTPMTHRQVPRPTSPQARKPSSGGARRGTVILCVSVLLLASCSRQTLEERAREQAEKVIGSMGSAQSRALEQRVPPEEVKQAQQALTQVHEYMGQINGNLDAVTVNAVEAFQRTHGLKDDGILNEKTQRLLREELAKK